MERINNFLSGRRASESSRPPYLLHIRSSKAFIISTICIAVFTDIFLYAVIVPVVPFALTARAGVVPEDAQKWVSVLLAVYGAALLVGAPISGWYADRSSSRRWPLLLGLVALAGATIMICLARTVVLLILGRLLQGLAGAVVWTVGCALLVDTVGQKDIGQVFGYVGISMSLGVLVAPLLGGVVYAKSGYYAVFYMAFGLIALDIVMRLLLVEKKIAAQWDETLVEAQPAEENTGQGSDSGINQTLTSPEKIETNELQGAVDRPISALKSPSRFHKYPPIFSLLTSRRLVAALWGCFVQAVQMTSFDSVVPLYVQQVFQWNSIGGGLVFLAIMIPNFAAPVVGAASDKYGPRWLTVVGFMLAMPFWVLLRLVTYNSLGQKVLFCALLSLIGVALTLVMPLMAEITYVVEAKEKKTPGIFGATGAYAQAYGLFVTAFAAGTLVGPIWAGYVRDAAGWGTMTWTLGLFSVTGAIPAFIWTGGLITKANAKSGEERAIRVEEASANPDVEKATAE